MNVISDFLISALHWDDQTADNLSNFFDLGGIIGTLVTGIISDFLSFRSPVVSLSLLSSVVLVFFYQAFGSVYVVNLILMVSLTLTHWRQMVSSFQCLAYFPHSDLPPDFFVFL